MSKATVSRALRNRPGHAEETKRRIIAAAKRMGYEAHPIMSAVMSSVRFKRASHFSAVIAEIHCQPWNHKRGGNMTVLRENIHAQAKKLGYGINEFNWYEPGMSQRRLLEIIRARGIRGVIFEYFMESEVDLAALSFDDLAVVSIGGALLKPKFHRVEVNHYGNLLKTIRLLRQRGYRRFGLVIPDIYEKSSDFKREAALYSASQMMDVDNPIPVFHQNADQHDTALARWLKRYKPDCILGVGANLPEKLAQLGYSCPDRIGFAHLGWHYSYKGSAGINPGIRAGVDGEGR